jgi:hypothetical protein
MGRVGNRRMGMWAMGIGLGFRGISSLSIVVAAIGMLFIVSIGFFCFMMHSHFDMMRSCCYYMTRSCCY